jgi:hypothetical protein
MRGGITRAILLRLRNMAYRHHVYHDCGSSLKHHSLEVLARNRKVGGPFF